MGWVGRLAKQYDGGIVVLHNARPLHAGLCVGSGDLIGFKTITITPDMIGKKVAVFGSLEVKMPNGRSTTAQKNFLKIVRQFGGFADVAHSEDEAIGLLHGWEPV